MKAVRLQYFAILREQRGLAQETLATAAPTAACRARSMSNSRIGAITSPSAADCR